MVVKQTDRWEVTKCGRDMMVMLDISLMIFLVPWARIVVTTVMKVKRMAGQSAM